MVFVDTHSNPDTERDRPVGYYNENLPEQYPTEFPKVSTFVKLKKLENTDPFCDPGDPFSVPPGFLLERSEVRMENRGQIASYAAALSGSQFRVHVYSVSLCEKTAQSACTSQDAWDLTPDSFFLFLLPHVYSRTP